MSEITKPSGVNLIWASGGDKLDPGSVKYQTGWGVELPPRQWENFIQNKQDQAIAHINQHGVAVWDSITEYQAAKSYVQGVATGAVYRCKTTNTAQNPETDATNTYWELAFASPGDFYTKTVADSTFLGTADNLADLSNTATARTNLGVYSKTETYTKTEVDNRTTIASTAQAQAWSSNTVLLTPLRLLESFQGSNQSLGASNFTSGYQKLPGGYIMQLVVISVPDGTSDAVLTSPWPVTFPTAVYGAICSIAGTTATRKANIAYNLSTTSAAIQVSNTGTGLPTNAYIFAVGK